MLSRVCEFPLPSSLVQTIRVLSSRLPARPARGFGQPLREVGELLAIPLVDLVSFSWAAGVAVWLVRQLMVPFVDLQPPHLRPAHRVGVLQGGDTGEVGGEAD